MRFLKFDLFSYDGQKLNELSDAKLLKLLKAIKLIVYSSYSSSVFNENELIKL